MNDVERSPLTKDDLLEHRLQEIDDTLHNHAHLGYDLTRQLDHATSSTGGTIGGGSDFITGSITTTNNTVTTANLVTLTLDTAVLAVAYITAKDIADDYYANFERAASCKNATGSVVFFDMLQDRLTMRQQVAWDVDFTNSSAILQIRVFGSNSQTIVWKYGVLLFPLS